MTTAPLLPSAAANVIDRVDGHVRVECCACHGVFWLIDAPAALSQSAECLPCRAARVTGKASWDRGSTVGSRF